MGDAQVLVAFGTLGTVLIGLFGFMPLLIKSESRGVRQQLNEKMDGGFARLDEKIDDQFDRVTSVTGVRFDGVDHRLGALEDDMLIVKAHLLGTRPAA